MGKFDQAARFAARSDPVATIGRVMTPTGLALPFVDWADTKSLSLPGSHERDADRIAILDDPPRDPYLLVLEFQSRHDPDKLGVTLEEAAVLRGHVRHGADGMGRYRVLTALIYLVGHCPASILDMTAPGGFGTRHVALVWDVAFDEAAATLEAVAAGRTSWGMLFWIPLMVGGEDPALIARWREVVPLVSPPGRIRGGLGTVARVFAELVGRRDAWVRGLGGFEMFDVADSELVKEWTRDAVIDARVDERQDNILKILNYKFPDEITPEVTRLINEQDSLELLSHWFQVALMAGSFQQFVDSLS